MAATGKMAFGRPFSSRRITAKALLLRTSCAASFSCSSWPVMYWFGSSSRNRIYGSGFTAIFRVWAVMVSRMCLAVSLPMALILGRMQARTMSD